MEIGVHAYIADSVRGRFHKGDCPDAAALPAGRRSRITCHRSRLLSQGYRPCTDCLP